VLISPALQSKIVHTTHRCSGRLFLVHLRHDEQTSSSSLPCMASQPHRRMTKRLYAPN
jgi:hypothetical protein